MARMKTITLLSILTFVAGMSTGPGTAVAAREKARESAARDAGREGVAAQLQAFMAAVRNRDAAAVANLYTTDAMFGTSPGGMLVGRASVEAFWRQALAHVEELELTTLDLLGDGDLRIETGRYATFGPDRADLGRGRYLIAWAKEDGWWKIAREFAHGDETLAAAASTSAASGQADTPELVNATNSPITGIGLPADYTARLHNLGGTVSAEGRGLSAVYANDALVAAVRGGKLPYPDGSVVLMEFSEPRYDGEQQLLHDERGQPLKGAITRIDMMWRASGADSPASAGAWQFASFKADGTPILDAAGARECAACHLKAGAEKDFVYRLRAWEPAR